MSEHKTTCTISMDLAMDRVKHYMDKIAENSYEGTRTGTVLQDVIGSSGKMVRPKLLLLCSAFGPDAAEYSDRFCMLAAMVELTHMASLIHDDIVDEAPCRRGKPSVQGKYGKDAAVYAGDFLIARIHYWLAKEQLNATGMALSKAIEEMCAGEIGQARCRYKEDVTVEEYLFNIKGKTSALFRTACMLGGLESGCSEETVAKLSMLGEYIGIIFQLHDDLLDFTSSKAKEGKEIHKDFQDGIYTMPVLLAKGSQEGRASLTFIMRENAKRSLTQCEIQEMERLVFHYGGIKGTIGEIHRYTSLCRQLVDSLEYNESAEQIKRMLDRFDEV